MDCKACGAPLAQKARGRTSEYCSDRCRKRGQRAREATTQLRLEFEVSSDVTKLDEPAHETSSDVTKLEMEELTFYSRAMMRYQGPHDQARRAWLQAYGAAQNYPSFWFTLHHRYSGYHQAGVPKGEDGWTHFIERAVQYDIYCAFIAAYAPGQLKRYLEDARDRGEITLGDALLWKPQ